MPKAGIIRVGVGGWNYEPWRETFYPPGTPQSRELEYSSRQLTAIEINGTFYRLQKPAVYAKWRDSTPDDFVFTLKGPRFIVQRKELASAGSAIERFFASGIAELQGKLGPILWQLEPHHAFNAEDLQGFLKLLAPSAGQVPLRHALEVRHASFMNPEFVALARAHRVALVCVDDAKYPGFADVTAGFVYVRLRQCVANVATGYAPPALKLWAARARTWASGAAVADLARIDPDAASEAAARDVFVYFINGAKERAPAAAQALLKVLR